MTSDRSDLPVAESSEAEIEFRAFAMLKVPLQLDSITLRSIRKLTGSQDALSLVKELSNESCEMREVQDHPRTIPPMHLSQSSREISGVFDSALASLDFNFLFFFRLLLFLLKVFLPSRWFISMSGETVSQNITEYHGVNM